MMSTPGECSILLVEDDAIIALSEKSILEHHGFSIEIAYTGEAAVQKARENNAIDLILMDIDLGHGMDGTDAAKTILEQRDIPIVFLSSHTEPEVVEKTEGITSYGYIVKNAGSTVLIASIKMALKLFRSQSSENHYKTALFESQALLRSIIDSTDDLIFALEPQDFRMMTYNRGLEKFFIAMPHELAIGMQPSDLLPPDLADAWNRRCHEPLKNGFVSDYVEAQNGRLYHLEMHLIEKSKRPFAISVFCRDIDDARRATEETAKFQRLIEVLSDAVYFANTDNQIYYANDAACKILGYERDELLALTIPDISINATTEKLASYWKQIRAGIPYINEVIHRRKDGTEFPVEITSTFVFHGGQESACTFARDITARKQTEQAIIQSNNRRMAILEALPDIFLEIDLHSTIFDFKAQHVEDLYLTTNEILGKKVIEILPPDAASIFIDALTEAAEKGWHSGAIYSLMIPQGKRWFDASISRMNDSQNGEEHFIVLVRDITERKLMEEEIKASELRFHLLFNSNPSPMVLTDLENGSITETNNAFETMMEYKRNEMIGLSTLDLGLWYSEDMRQNARELLLTKGHLRNFEARVKTKSGRIIDVILNSEIVALNDRRYFLTGCTDITQQKQAEDKINILNQHITNLQEEERQRIAKDLHDSVSQTLSAALLMFKSLPEYAEPNREPFNIGVQLIENASTEIREIYTNLYPSVLEHMGLIAAIKWYSRYQLQAKGITCELDLSDNISIDHSTEVHLYRILQEVISNIVRHSAADQVSISLHYENDELRLSIVDNGKGFMIDETLERGTGYGILNIRHRINTIKGKLTIESNQTSGTSITITIPNCLLKQIST